MTQPENPMEGVTDRTIELPVTAGQFNYLAETAIHPGRPRTTHKVGVGPFVLPGLWVVIGAKQTHGPLGGSRYTVILAKLVED